MAPQRRESTPDTPTSELRSRYLSVTKDANIDTKTAQYAMAMFETLQEKFNVEGDPVEWLLPGAYAYSISQKASNVESKVVLWKLFKATSLSVPVFYQRVKKWGEVAGLPTGAKELFSRSERYFLMSKTIFGSFEQMYTCVFRDPLDADLLKNVTDRAMSLRKKQKVVFPKIVQSVDVYVFTWDLYVRCRLSAHALRDDLISCYHLLICVLDYVCANVLVLKRAELLNPGCSIIPKVGEADEKTISTFSLIPYLCAKFEGISRDCQILYSNGFLPVLQQLIKDQELTTDGPGVNTGLLSPDNFEKNVKSLNSVYENQVRITMAADERVFLVSGDVNSPGIGGDPLNVMDVIETMKERRKILPSINRKLEMNDFKTPTPVVTGLSISTASTPLTPNSSCSVLERREQQESAKTPALHTAVDLVTQLTNLTAGRTTKPSGLLVELLKTVYEEDVSAGFTKRAADYVEKLVKAYTEACDPKGQAEPYIRARFMFAQTWYFKMLEDVLVSEKQRSAATFTRMKRLIDAERFQKSMLALAVEMILYSYNCSRMFPWPIEALEVSPFDFVKVIEPVVRLEPLPRSITKHLARIEETIFEQLVWRSESPVWTEIAAEETRSVREVCWAHNLEENPTTGPRLPTTVSVEAPAMFASPSTPSSSRRIKKEPASPGAAAMAAPSPSAAPAPADTPSVAVKPPKSSAICLFFRKVYVLAAARLRDLCDKLGFDQQIEAKYHVFQRMFTLFEEVLSKHTSILKDRHLDQILLCCAYVIAKLETSNGLGKTFHTIMNAYRYQNQAESTVYRSVLLSKKAIVPSPPVPASIIETRRRAAQNIADQNADPISQGEVRTDIIRFYNEVFVDVMKDFIANLTPKKKGPSTVVLSPVPSVSGNIIRRQVHPGAPIYVSPMRKEEPQEALPNGRVLQFTFGVSDDMSKLVFPDQKPKSTPRKKRLNPDGSVTPRTYKRGTKELGRRASKLSPGKPVVAGPANASLTVPIPFVPKDAIKSEPGTSAS